MNALVNQLMEAIRFLKKENDSLQSELKSMQDERDDLLNRIGHLNHISKIALKSLRDVTGKLRGSGNGD